MSQSQSQRSSQTFTLLKLPKQKIELDFSISRSSGPKKKRVSRTWCGGTIPVKRWGARLSGPYQPSTGNSNKTAAYASTSPEDGDLIDGNPPAPSSSERGEVATKKSGVTDYHSHDPPLWAEISEITPSTPYRHDLDRSHANNGRTENSFDAPDCRPRA